MFRYAVVAFAALTLTHPFLGQAEPLTPLVSLELFTSQSCHSCPPAEALLGELADRETVLALEWHVNYWDDLVYGSKGRWKDVYSKPEFTQRQRGYNSKLRGSASIYTPQLIIQGRTQVVGSRPREVMPALARAEGRLASNIKVDKQVDRLLVTTSQPVIAHLIRVEKRRTVDVKRGENAGKTLHHRNAVLEVKRFELIAGASPLPLQQLPDNEACALLIQDGEVGEVLFAGKCS